MPMISRSSTGRPAVCTDDTPAGHIHPAPLLHDFEPSVTFDLEPVDSVTVTTLMDNITDIFMPDQGPAHRPPPGTGGRRPAAVMEGGLAPDALLAEHGFSVLVTVAKNGSPHHVPFRAGPSPDGGIGNMDRLEIDPAGFEVIEEREPSFLFGRSVLVTGEVPRTTGYEPGFPPQQAWLGGRWEPDPLVLDDQALIVDVKDKGLVVITGCGHAGVINMCRYARRLPGARPRHAVIGGFHLNGPLFEPLIPRVVDDLAALAPISSCPRT